MPNTRNPSLRVIHFICRRDLRGQILPNDFFKKTYSFFEILKIIVSRYIHIYDIVN